MSINLLPPKFKQEKQIRKISGMIFLSLAVIFVILVIITGGVFAANVFVKMDIEQIKQKNSEQERIMKRYSEIEEKVNNFNAKIGKIEAVDKGKILWSSILEELAKTTPTTVQIKTLALTGDTKKVSITGYAESRNDIANFKEKMESSKYFKNVTFSSSVHNEENKNFSYNISCEIEEIK